MLFFFPSRRSFAWEQSSPDNTQNKSQSFCPVRGLDLIIPLLSPVIIAYQYIQTYSYGSHDTGFTSLGRQQEVHLLNPFLIALIETGQRGKSGPVEYLKMKRPSLQYGCFFMKLFPSALTGCPGEVRICKIHFCQSYNQNKRFFIKNQSKLTTMLFLSAAGRNLRQKSPKHICTQNTWAYSPTGHLGAGTIFEYNFWERKIEHSTYKEHGFGRY